MEWQNAIIESTFLGKEDHGIPSFMLDLRFDSAGQGFGGYDLRVYGIDLVMKIISIVGADSWEQLRGKVIRFHSSNGRIIAIGHITEDRWLSMDAERERVEKLQEVSRGA